MSYQLSAPYLNMSLGCYDMYCTCSGECPLALHAGPALMFYGDPLGSALSGHVFMFPSLMPCGDFIGWKRRESLDCYHPFPGGNEYPSCSTGYREGPVFSFINSDGTRQAPIFSSQVKIDFILAIRGPKGIFGARGGWERLSWYLTGPTFDIWAGLTTASSEWFNQAFRFVFLLNSLRTV